MEASFGFWVAQHQSPHFSKSLSELSNVIQESLAVSLIQWLEPCAKQSRGVSHFRNTSVLINKGLLFWELGDCATAVIRQSSWNPNSTLCKFAYAGAQGRAWKRMGLGGSQQWAGEQSGRHGASLAMQHQRDPKRFPWHCLLSLKCKVPHPCSSVHKPALSCSPTGSTDDSYQFRQCREGV